MIRTQIQLTDRQMKKLKAMANARNISVAELIRESVDRMIESPEIISLEERRKRAIAVLGKFHSDKPGENVSENHDDYLADIYNS